MLVSGVRLPARERRQGRQRGAGRGAGVVDVFISYAHEDRGRAAVLAAALEHDGLSVWWDDHLLAGTDFEKEIRHKLQQAKCIVVLWSHNSIESGFVKAEADEGKLDGKLVPAIIDPIKPPFNFRDVHYTSLVEWAGDRDDPNYTHLLRSVGRLIEAAAAPASAGDSGAGSSGAGGNRAGGFAEAAPPPLRPPAPPRRHGPLSSGHVSPEEHGRPQASPWLRWLAYSAVAIAVLLVDPFGMFAAAQRLSQDSANRILGPLYPTTGRDQVSVVLWRDTSLAGLGLTWPIPLSWHARALEAILSHQPKAVFVDIAYTNDRGDPGLARLRAAIEDYAQEGVPLLFAAPTDAGEKIIAGLADLLSAERLAGVPEPIEDGFSREYPYEITLGNRRFKTAAFEMLQRSGPADEGMQILSPAMSRPVEVVWGTEPHPLNRALIEDCAAVEATPPVQRLITALVRPGGLVRPCPYSATMPIHALLDSTRDRRFAERIEGKYVILGAAVPSAPDEVTTPVNGRLPGAHLHAMALDNLLTFGAHYKSRQPAALFKGIKAVVVVLMLAPLMMAVGGDRSPAGVPGRRRWGRGIAAVMVAIAIAGAAALLTFAVADFPPADWLGTLGLALAVALLARSGVVEELGGRVIRRRALRAQAGIQPS